MSIHDHSLMPHYFSMFHESEWCDLDLNKEWLMADGWWLNGWINGRPQILGSPNPMNFTWISNQFVGSPMKMMMPFLWVWSPQNLTLFLYPLRTPMIWVGLPFSFIYFVIKKIFFHWLLFIFHALPYSQLAFKMI